VYVRWKRGARRLGVSVLPLSCYMAVRSCCCTVSCVLYDDHAAHTTPTITFKTQALFKRVSGSHQPPRVSIDSGAYIFHYLLEGGACFLTLTEKGYPKASGSIVGLCFIGRAQLCAALRVRWRQLELDTSRCACAEDK